MELTPETIWRFGVFAAVFAVMAMWEAWRPRRARITARVGRWPTNLTIVGLGVLVVRVLAFLAPTFVAVGVAAIAHAHGWGVLNAFALPWWLAMAITVIVLDFAIWLQHVLSHRMPLLWRLHRVHHADIDFDVTTGLRFHPIEIGLSMIYKSAWVLLLGAPVMAVVVFETLLNTCAVFNHANARLPAWLDMTLRTVIVTPDMHRVHHSIERCEHNSNFGFNLSIWDRLFRTYRAEPALGHDGMTIGLSDYQTTKPTELGWSLALPFRRRVPKE